MSTNYRRVKLACYATNSTMAVVSNLSPLLFLTFRSLYGISYTLLGLLVLINFVTQLTVDFVFSFYSHRIPIPTAVKMMPWLGIFGLLIYSLGPWLAPSAAYLFLVVGTVISSACSGFGEVLVSPVIAAIPSDEPEREMSKLHSVYAWGVVGVVLVSTVYLLCFGGANWHWLAMGLVLVPLTAAILYSTAELPPMEAGGKTESGSSLMRDRGLWLCFLALFLGGAAECTMAQWCSSYLEKALEIPKVWGDVLGVALFAFTLGVGRSLYAKAGKNLERVLLISAVGASVCYLTAAISSAPILGLLACGLTGLCASMMWPGGLLLASEKFPSGGVFLFAMMAAGGDLGAAVGPQLVGVVTDLTMAGTKAAQLAAKLSLEPEQLGMKLGMLVGMLFPLAAIVVYRRFQKKPE